MTRALVFLPGRGAVHGAVDVYRDGDAVVCVGRVGAMKRARAGKGHVHFDADVVLRFDSIAAYDAEKAALFERHPEKYALAVGAFRSLDDDARHAPEIPERLKAAIDGRRSASERLLSSGEASGETSGDDRDRAERSGRPVLRLLPAVQPLDDEEARSGEDSIEVEYEEVGS